MDPIFTPETPELSPGLQFDEHIRTQVSETVRWAKFLSIMGFIFCGLMVILAFFMNVFMSKLPYQDNNPMSAFRSFISIFYLAFAVLYFFPCLNLFRFATKAQLAFANNSQADINASFTQLKSFFKFVGIITIVVLGIYVLALIIIFGVIAMLKH